MTAVKINEIAYSATAPMARNARTVSATISLFDQARPEGTASVDALSCAVSVVFGDMPCIPFPCTSAYTMIRITRSVYRCLFSAFSYGTCLLPFRLGKHFLLSPCMIGAHCERKRLLVRKKVSAGKKMVYLLQSLHPVERPTVLKSVSLLDQPCEQVFITRQPYYKQTLAWHCCQSDKRFSQRSSTILTLPHDALAGRQWSFSVTCILWKVHIVLWGVGRRSLHNTVVRYRTIVEFRTCDR